MTEREKMIAGMVYDSMDAELVAGRENARRLCWLFSPTSPDKEEEIARIVAELLPNVKKPILRPPFFAITASIFTATTGFIATRAASFSIAPALA